MSSALVASPLPFTDFRQPCLFCVVCSLPVGLPGAKECLSKLLEVAVREFDVFVGKIGQFGVLSYAD